MEKIDYSGKVSYVYETASNYEKDRIVEAIWNKEQKFVEKLVKKCKKDNIILDIPVGTGRFIEIYKSAGIKVIGIDVSPAMLEEAKTKNGYNIELRLGDITKLDLEPKFVDVTICWRLIHLLPEDILKKGIYELTRVTKREIIIQSFHMGKLSIFYRLLNYFKSRIFSKTEEAKVSKTEPWKSIQSYSHDENLLINEFNKNGFKLKGRQLLDAYKGEPVYVYIFRNE